MLPRVTNCGQTLREGNATYSRAAPLQTNVAIIDPRDEPFTRGRLISQRGLCPQPNAIVVVASSSGPGAAFTPKELRLIAQGCEWSELPWVRET